MTHELKCWPTPFEAMLKGDKTHEIRRTDDRSFNVGDLLRLHEWSELDGYTGRVMHAVVYYVSAGGHWGLPEKLCVMSVRVRGLEPELPKEQS